MQTPAVCALGEAGKRAAAAAAAAGAQQHAGGLHSRVVEPLDVPQDGYRHAGAALALKVCLQPLQEAQGAQGFEAGRGDGWVGGQGLNAWQTQGAHICRAHTSAGAWTPPHPSPPELTCQARASGRSASGPPAACTRGSPCKWTRVAEAAHGAVKVGSTGGAGRRASGCAHQQGRTCHPDSSFQDVPAARACRIGSIPLGVSACIPPAGKALPPLPPA